MFCSHSGGKTGSCSTYKTEDPLVSVASYSTIKSAGLTTKAVEAAMASYVESTGPLAHSASQSARPARPELPLAIRSLGVPQPRAGAS